MSLDALHELAKREGKGSPILILDLAALDANLATIRSFAAGQGWDIRPALKSFRSPELCGYVLRSLAKPLGLIFALREADAVVAACPRNTDLMTGWAPTYGELARYLRTKPPAKQRRHRMRILIDSVPLMQELARLARGSRRPLPIEVALELDVGMGRGGISDRTELADCLAILRANRDRLQLSAVIGYDGHATLDGNDAYRVAVAAQAQTIFRLRLAELAGLGAGLYDERTLVRNGPGSSNYRNWVGGPINEISPGSAFMRAGYLDTGFDQDGLAYALTFAGAVRRVTSDHPSVPVTGTTAARGDPAGDHRPVDGAAGRARLAVRGRAGRAVGRGWTPSSSRRARRPWRLRALSPAPTRARDRQLRPDRRRAQREGPPPLDRAASSRAADPPRVSPGCSRAPAPPRLLARSRPRRRPRAGRAPPPLPGRRPRGRRGA